MRDPRLSKAILMWRLGHRIPLTLELQLLNAGYDVARLEARYRA